MLRAEVLGRPAEDNALLVTADSGQGQTRLLLDCGAATLQNVPFADVQAIDHLLFTHLHMDHVGGFDDFFRANYERSNRENHIWGPPGTARILSHRFRGYWWNFAPDLTGTWFVHDVHPAEIQSYRFGAHEAFEVQHSAGTRAHDGVILQTPEVSVQAVPLQHHGVSLGFILREPEKVTVRREALAELGLKGGPWLNQLKSGVSGELAVGEQRLDADELRAKLLQRESGESVALFTDFLLNETELTRLAPVLSGVQTLYAEAQYAPQDAALAEKNHHTTVEQVATLARDAGVEKLVLLHLSRRYRPEQWSELLAAARQIFPQATLPAHWGGPTAASSRLAQDAPPSEPGLSGSGSVAPAAARAGPVVPGCPASASGKN